MRSNFIKQVIRGMHWTKHNREHIDTLLSLERFILNGPGGYASALRFHGLKNEYQQAYELLLKELRPDLYRTYLEEKIKADQHQKEEVIKEAREKEKSLKKEKAWWRRMGGIIPS